VIRIPCKLLDPKCKPARQTEGAVGYDLVAREETELPPMRVTKVPVGVCLELAAGQEAQVRPRSSLPLRGLVGIFGTIDSDYRGEIAVLMLNTTAEPGVVRRYDRIGQLVFARVDLPDLRVAESIGGTTRGTKGFGSTGVGDSCPACGLIFERNAPCLDCGVCNDCHARHPQKHEYRR
jgi:dUTP pyrophosphatase